MTPVPLVAIVGAGLAGLAAALAAIEHGGEVVVLEHAATPGGATIDSAGWIWRYGDTALARACAPHADAAVREAIIERLDADLQWLAAAGVALRSRETGRSFTRGARVDPPQMIDLLARRVERHSPGALRCRCRVVAARPRDGGGARLLIRESRPGRLVDAPDVWLDADAVVFAGGGYAGDLPRVAREATLDPAVAEHWMQRTLRAGDGSSMDAAIELGAVRVPATGESFVRLVPDVRVRASPRALSSFGELQLPDAVLRDAAGHEIPRLTHDWSGAQAAWALAIATGSGRLELPRAALREHVHGGLVDAIVRDAISAGAPSGRSDDSGIWVGVRAGITHTMCGLRVDADARLRVVEPGNRAGREPATQPLPGAWAAGCDAAGSGLGGTASGLAQALVLGRRAGTLAASG